MIKIADTRWLPEHKLIITELRGNVNSEDVEKWISSLYQALDQIEDNGVFKIFINLMDFQAVDLDVHKKYREIIPRPLGEYGWKVGYVDMFERAKELQLSNKRGIQCVAAVHVHQDETKIQKYEDNYSRENEHYFTDIKKAEDWIYSYPV
ncbi:MAG TPA: hypothetical protein PKX55_20805 [Leptospiraceae bacterium]|nr:hypothetical protein [Leptospiraceae bacterium]